MARRINVSAAAWLVLAVALALLLPSSFCAAEPIKTTPVVGGDGEHVQPPAGAAVLR